MYQLFAQKLLTKQNNKTKIKQKQTNQEKQNDS